jgi:hypothetical protein
MKRVVGILAGVGLGLLVIGCAEPYDGRVKTTIENKKYQMTLDKNLEKAPEDANFKSRLVYVRPPLGFKGPVELGIVVVEPGKFDMAKSFIDANKQAGLHILARDNRPKGATPKKGADPSKAAEPQAARGDFTADVLDLVKGAYSVDLDAQQLKADTKAHGARNNAYKTKTLDANTKEVQVWIYGDKNSPSQVALIFDYPKDSRNSLTSAITYCLQSFGAGRVAESLYAGRDELSGEEAAPPSGVF